MKPIELHFFPTMNGRKILIALEEMALPYILKKVDIRKGDQLQPSFLAISPNGRMPAIVDPDGPDGNLISVFESGAILLYLARKTGRFYPTDERERVEVDQWLMWQMSGLGPMTGQAGHFGVYAPLLVDHPDKIEYSCKRYFNEVNRLHGVLDRRLNDREFVAGAYSIADMSICPWLDGVERLGHDIGQFPNVSRWYEQVRNRPAVRKGWVAGDHIAAKTSAISDDEKIASARVLFGQGANPAATAAIR
jgi:glutathione S-transferase